MDGENGRVCPFGCSRCNWCKLIFMNTEVPHPVCWRRDCVVQHMYCVQYRPVAFTAIDEIFHISRSIPFNNITCCHCPGRVKFATFFPLTSASWTKVYDERLERRVGIDEVTPACARQVYRNTYEERETGVYCP